MFDGLITLPAFAPTIFNPWHLTWEEKLPKADFPCSHLYHQRAMFLFSPIWNLTVPFLGAGSSLCNSRPRRSFVHSSFHSHIACLVNWVFFADSSSLTSEALVAVDRVFSSLTPQCLSFFNLQPVASFADLSAASLPRRPIWAGIQWISTVDPLYLRRSIVCTICCTMCCPDFFFGDPTALIAAWLSTQISTTWGSSWASRDISVARKIPYSSPEYTVNESERPRTAFRVVVGYL